MGAAGTHLAADGVGDRLVVLGAERRRHADRLGEHRGLAGGEPGADLLVDDRRDAEAGVLDQVALDLVGEHCGLCRVEAARTADAGDLAEAVGEHGRRPLQVEVAVARQLEHPRAAELGDLLLDRQSTTTRKACCS